MKFRTRLIILLISINIVALLFTSIFIINSFKTELENTILESGEIIVNSKYDVFDTHLNEHKNELLLLSKSEFMIRYAQNLSNEYKENVIDLSKSIMSSDDEINQIRFIDSSGMEIIVISKISDDIQSVENFQNKVERDYFQKTIILSDGEIHSSSITLNEEFGKITVPHIPIFRLSTPIYSEDSLQGILIMNVDANDIFQSIESVQEGDMIIIDQNGQFILHPDNTKTFSKQLNTNYNYFDEQPELKLNLEKQDSRINNDVKEDEIRIWKKLFYDEKNKDVYWVILNKISKNEMFNSIDFLFVQAIVITSISSLGVFLLAIIFSNKFSNQIRELRNFSEGFRSGKFDQIKVTGSDEIQELAISLNKTSNDLLILTDIKAQLLLQNNLRKALDESSIVAITDSKGTITYVNEYFCQISQYSKEELIGENHRILKSGKHSEKFYEDLWKIISSGNTWNGEIINKAKDGTLYWVDTTIIPFLDKTGKISEYVAIRNDITEQKILTQKLIDAEKLSAIGELSARIAHDMRNPLSVIETALENIRLKRDDPQFFEKSMARCNRAVKRITHQIDIVMDFLKESPLKLESISFSNFIQSIVSNMDIPDRIKLVLPTNDITILGDNLKLESLFNNLILNAIQAIDGKGTITVRISDEPNNMIKIQVEDDGKPIPTESLTKIFEPLFTTKQSGTGLGLASCKKIVEQHQGTISVSNDPVTFTIIFPASYSDNV